MARFTENEIKVIKQFNLNYDNLSSELSDNAFDEIAKLTGIAPRSLRGIMTSLIKKGIIYKYRYDDDIKGFMYRVTDDGIREYFTIGLKKDKADEDERNEVTCNFIAEIRADGNIHGIKNGEIRAVNGTATFERRRNDYGNGYFMRLGLEGNEMSEIYDCRYDMRLHPTKENGFAEFTKEFMTTSYWTGNPWTVTEIDVEELR